MKPFDLEAAKRGEPVCTKAGNAVQIVHISDDKKVYEGHQILGYVTSIDGSKLVGFWYLDGRHVHAAGLHLHMAPKKVKVYLFVTYNSYSPEGFSTSSTSLERIEKAKEKYIQEEGNSKVSEIVTVEVEM